MHNTFTLYPRFRLPVSTPAPQEVALPQTPTHPANHAEVQLAESLAASTEAVLRGLPDVQSTENLALFFVKAGQRTDAIRLLEAGADKFPDSRLPLRLAQLLIQDKQAARALDVVQQWVRSYAGTRYHTGDGQLAASLYEEAFLLQPGIPVMEVESLRSALLREEFRRPAEGSPVNRISAWLANVAIFHWLVGEDQLAERARGDIDPPDENTITALLTMGDVQTAFRVLDGLSEDQLDRVWWSPHLDELLSHDRSDRFTARSHVNTLRRQGIPLTGQLRQLLRPACVDRRGQEVTEAILAIERLSTRVAAAPAQEPARVHELSSLLEAQTNELLGGLIVEVQQLQAEGAQAQLDSRRSGQHFASCFYSENLTQAEQMLRWALDTYPHAEAVPAMTQLLAEVLLQSGRYAESRQISLAPCLASSPRSTAHRFLAKAMLARTPGQMQALRDEIANALSTDRHFPGWASRPSEGPDASAELQRLNEDREVAHWLIREIGRLLEHWAREDTRILHTQPLHIANSWYGELLKHMCARKFEARLARPRETETVLPVMAPAA